MVKICKVVVCGPKGTGKTSLLEQLIYGQYNGVDSTCCTIEDIYVATIETDRGQREKVRFFDTAGWILGKPEIPKQYFSVADAFVLLYDVTDLETFNDMDKVKKDIDKLKEKKEAAVISLGNKCDMKEQKAVDFSMANKWAQKEKVRLWEVSVANRQSLVEPFVWLTSKITAPPNKSGFGLSMGMGKKAKATLDT